MHVRFTSFRSSCYGETRRDDTVPTPTDRPGERRYGLKLPLSAFGLGEEFFNARFRRGPDHLGDHVAVLEGQLRNTKD